MPSHVAFLRAESRDLTGKFQTTTLTNAALERITGLTMPGRDLEVVRTIDEKWGA
ncbi:MAG: hypothetical protein ABIQ92_00475 [Ornithinibacter sp.]